MHVAGGRECLQRGEVDVLGVGAPLASGERAGSRDARLPRGPVDRADLGPAEEPELVRVLGMLELQRRRFVRDRTQAIQRLRSDWTQHDPVAEAGVIRCDRQQELNKLRRLQLGSSLATRTAARCIRELARDITDLNKRIAELDGEIARLLKEHDNPLADLHGAGSNLAATIIAQAGDVRRFRNASAFARFCGAAPIPCGSGQTANRHRLHRGGNRQLNAALFRIAVVQLEAPRSRTRSRRDRSRSRTSRAPARGRHGGLVSGHRETDNAPCDRARRQVRPALRRNAPARWPAEGPRARGSQRRGDGPAEPAPR